MPVTLLMNLAIKVPELKKEQSGRGDSDPHLFKISSYFKATHAQGKELFDGYLRSNTFCSVFIIDVSE